MEALAQDFQAFASALDSRLTIQFFERPVLDAASSDKKQFQKVSLEDVQKISAAKKKSDQTYLLVLSNSDVSTTILSKYLDKFFHVSEEQKSLLICEAGEQNSSPLVQSKDVEYVADQLEKTAQFIRDTGADIRVDAWALKSSKEINFAVYSCGKDGLSLLQNDVLSANEEPQSFDLDFSVLEFNDDSNVADAIKKFTDFLQVAPKHPKMKNDFVAQVTFALCEEIFSDLNPEDLIIGKSVLTVKDLKDSPEKTDQQLYDVMINQMPLLKEKFESIFSDQPNKKPSNKV